VEKRRDAYMVGKPEGKRPIGRTSRRWEAIKIDLQNRVTPVKMGHGPHSS
jgi:hypothetical protein